MTQARLGCPNFRRVPREIRLTSADRVRFPDDGITKADLFDYYDAIAPGDPCRTSATARSR
jgi:hypothetical protein